MSVKKGKPMGLEVIDRNQNGTLEVRITGKFSLEDRSRLEAEFPRGCAEPGRRRLLVAFHDLDGSDPAGLWPDAKPADTPFFDIARLALVGERPWEAWMTRFCQPFIFSTIRYFTPDRAREARQWLERQTACPVVLGASEPGEPGRPWLAHLSTNFSI